LHSIYDHVVLYVSAMGFKVRKMPEFAIKAIERTTERFKTTFLAQFGQGRFVCGEVVTIEVPLRRSVELLYAERDIKGYIKMRIALARLLEVALPFLSRQPFFDEIYRSFWEPMWRSWYVDIKTFRSTGLLPSRSQEIEIESEGLIRHYLLDERHLREAYQARQESDRAFARQNLCRNCLPRFPQSDE
jgi:hypothetical protein